MIMKEMHTGRGEGSWEKMQLNAEKADIDEAEGRAGEKGHGKETRMWEPRPRAWAFEYGRVLEKSEK